VEALACGKPVLISDQVNIWREIVEDGAGLVEGDTEEGVEKLLRRFLDGMRHEADDGASHSRPQGDRQLEELSEAFKLTQPTVGRQTTRRVERSVQIDTAVSARQPEANKHERPAADRTGGNADCRMTSTAGGLSAESLNVPRSTLNSTMGHRARACYLQRFAIGPAAAQLAEALKD